MVDHHVSARNLGVVGFGRSAGTDLVANPITAVADRDGTTTARQRPVGTCSVEGGRMVDDDVAGNNFEPDQVRVVVVGANRRDRFALGAW